MNENNSWVAPEIKELGNAEKLVKSVDWMDLVIQTFL